LLAQKQGPPDESYPNWPFADAMPITVDVCVIKCLINLLTKSTSPLRRTNGAMPSGPQSRSFTWMQKSGHLCAMTPTGLRTP